MRQEALGALSSYIENLPAQWVRSITGMNILLKRAWEILDTKGLEIDQLLDVIKTIANLTQTRLAMYSEPEMMKRAAIDRLKLKEEIDKLKRAGSKWQPTTEYAKGEKVRKWKQKANDEEIIVV